MAAMKLSRLIAELPWRLKSRAVKRACAPERRAKRGTPHILSIRLFGVKGSQNGFVLWCSIVPDMQNFLDIDGEDLRTLACAAGGLVRGRKTSSKEKTGGRRKIGGEGVGVGEGRRKTAFPETTILE